jgi:hypothetical protein
MWPLSFPVLSVSSPCTGQVPLTRFNLSFQSPLCTWGSLQPNSQSPFHLLSTHGLSSPQFLVPHPSPLCARVEFPSTPFSVPLLFMHRLGSSELNFHSPPYAIGPWFPTWSSNTCANVLQVW